MHNPFEYLQNKTREFENLYKTMETGYEAVFLILKGLLLGQLISFILACTSFAASLAANLGVHTPLSLAFLTFSGLTFVYGSILLYRRQTLQVSWYWYALLAFIDLQGNYLQNKSFQYSSITSVALLDCFTIPWVIILTWIFLGTRYTLRQFIGAAVCIVGLGFVLLSDSKAETGSGGPKPLLGDTLIFAATFFYAISNSAEEFCVKRKDRIEALAMMGIFGVLVTSCEIAMFERKNLESVKWSPEIIMIFAGFGVGSFLFYTLFSISLKMSGATMINLSLLTSDMWAAVIRIFFYRQKIDWLYYFSFTLVVIGLIIYSKFENDHAPLPALENENFDPEYQQLDGEIAVGLIKTSPIGS